MELRIGDYVRTIKYGIRKIEMVIDEPDRKGIRFNDTDGWNKGVPEEDIIKSSPNIIDLIEVGDIIKGIGNMIFSVINVDYKDKIIYGIDFWCEEKDIKSIVTREMFESIAYKVKE